MNDNEKQFWGLVESFIAQANEATENIDTGIVVSALIESAARYSAFYSAAGAAERKEFKAELNTSIEEFSEDYKKRLVQNFEDYLENYKIYMAE